MALYRHNEVTWNTLMALNRNSLIGAKFGNLTVIDKGHSNTKNSNWICKCSCGNIITVSRPLLIKHKTSCGCIVNDRTDVNVKHGNSTRKTGSTREYITWQSMNQRCANIHDPYYGGRGITVCDRWKHGENGKDGFSLFLLDMGVKPKNHDIDRIDNDRGYSPDNCRWATKSENASNRRSNVHIVIGSEKKTLTQWAKQFNVHPNTVKTFSKLLNDNLDVIKQLLRD